MARFSIAAEVQRFLRERISACDCVIDATLGNGHDALFLADAIGDGGRLFGFDVQAAAITKSCELLASRRLEHRATLINQGHQLLAASLPAQFHGRVSCVMFNLGYLPGGDKLLTTQIDSTLAALAQSCEMLADQGCISVVAYTGHAGGRDECDAVKAWASGLAESRYNVTIHNLLPQHKQPPEWILIEKIA